MRTLLGSLWVGKWLATVTFMNCMAAALKPRPGPGMQAAQWQSISLPRLTPLVQLLSSSVNEKLNKIWCCSSSIYFVMPSGFSFLFWILYDVSVCVCLCVYVYIYVCVWMNLYMCLEEEDGPFVFSLWNEKVLVFPLPLHPVAFANNCTPVFSPPAQWKLYCGRLVLTCSCWLHPQLLGLSCDEM